MPSIYTIEGAKSRKRKSDGKACKFVGSGKRRRCLCPTGRRWKFVKNSSNRCG